MIRFEQPLMLLLAVPWLWLGLRFARVQHRACRWIWSHVAERHRPRLTLLTPRNLWPQTALLLLIGLLLIAATARPTRGGGTVRETTGRVVLVLDASASMRASDVEIPDAASGQRQDRFELARGIARELVGRLDGFRFALVSFSGAATVQLPMTADRALAEEALRVVEIHNFYRRSGSSFAAALDRVLSFVEEGRNDLQAVLLSDGEPPFEEAFDQPLAALAARGVPVHAVALGSLEGQTREIYDLRDILAETEKPGVLREFTTRRVDRHLARIARDTDGRFEVAEGGDIEPLVESLARALRRQAQESESTREGARADPSVVLLALVLLGLAVETLVPRSALRGPVRFDLRRLGTRRGSGARAAVFVLAAVSSPLALLTVNACAGDDPATLANIENEKGIEADRVALRPVARTHYERSRAYGVRPEIPTYNLARSVFLQHDYSEAHELYQQALEIAPDLPEAHYNDGHALYRWGVAERDPQGCHLLRTLELWQAAETRFATALELYDRFDGPGSPDSERSQANLRFMRERIDRIQQLLAKPPPECSDKPPGQPLGALQGGGGESRGGGEGTPRGGEPQENAESPRQEDGSPPDPPPDENPEQSPPQAPGGAPLTPEEVEQIAQALERLREQGREGSKFHRRTRAEQFPAESWKDPDREIWW